MTFNHDLFGWGMCDSNTKVQTISQQEWVSGCHKLPAGMKVAALTVPDEKGQPILDPSYT